jgi:hypothetical protein
MPVNDIPILEKKLGYLKRERKTERIGLTDRQGYLSSEKYNFVSFQANMDTAFFEHMNKYTYVPGSGKFAGKGSPNGVGW